MNVRLNRNYILERVTIFSESFFVYLYYFIISLCSSFSCNIHLCLYMQGILVIVA